MKTKIVRLSKEEIAAKMRIYEEKYAMSSEEFSRKYFRGEMGDAEEFINWIGLWRMWTASEDQRSRSA